MFNWLLLLLPFPKKFCFNFSRTDQVFVYQNKALENAIFEIGSRTLESILTNSIYDRIDQLELEWVRTNKGDVKIEEACLLVTTSILDGLAQFTNWR